MTASVPDGISFGDLQNLMNDAHEREEQVKQEEPTPEQLMNGYQEKINDACNAGLDISLEKCEDPMVHKLMALKIMSNMIDWHTKTGKNLIEDGEADTAVAWLRDAGKFQSIINILLEIEIGEKDWTIKN